MACSGCCAAPSAALADVFVCRACIAARASQPRPRALWRRSQCNGMAPLFLWTAVLAVAGLRLTVSAMPMLPEQQGDLRADLRAADRLGLVPSSILEWYLQQRELQPQPVVEMESSQPQFQQVQQFRQWLDSQLARLPAASDPEDPSKALVAPQPKRGNYMALCHFKICNMGRKRSPRIQTQDLP